MTDLERHSDTDGESSVRTGMRELLEHRYVTITRVRAAGGGKFLDADWVLDDQPQRDFPHVENPHVENSALDNSGMENHDTLKTEDLKTEDLTKEELSSTILYGEAADSPPQHTNGHQDVAALPKKKRPREVKPLPEDDWLKVLLLEYADSFDVAALDDDAWWTDTGNSFPTFTHEWVSMAFASLARWFRENPKRVPRQPRYWKQRMNFSLNWYYDKHVRRT